MIERVMDDGCIAVKLDGGRTVSLDQEHSHLDYGMP